eukprot:scaffold9268_cov52-Attheya_sp.AAC.3
MKTVLDCHCLLPFPLDYIEYRQLLSSCFPSGVWRHVSVIQEELLHVLGQTAEAAQGIFTKKLMDQSMWTYLCFKALAGGCRGPQTVNMSVFKRATKPGMDLSKFVARHECKLLHFETQSDINVLCSILGESTIMNVRANMPPHGRPDEPATDRELNENDIINVINGDMEREDPFLCYTNQDGLDCVYDFKAGRAILAAAEEAAHNKVQVEIDSDFLHNGELYRVIEHGAFGIHAECIIPPTSLLRQFGENYVRVQVKRLDLINNTIDI